MLPGQLVDCVALTTLDLRRCSHLLSLGVAERLEARGCGVLLDDEDEDDDWG